MKIKVTKIEYCIEEEDVIDLVEERLEKEREDMPETYINQFDDDDRVGELIDEEIEKIESKLPKELVIEVYPDDVNDEDEINDLVCDEISDETGFLIESFEWEIIEI